MTLPERSKAHFWVARRARTLEQIVPALLVVLAALALLHTAPGLERTPGQESGGFLAAGDQMLRGAVLYRDQWNMHPPLGPLLNALGLLLGGPGRWGVWLLEIATTGAAALLLYGFLRRFFGPFPAFFSAAALLGSLVFVFDHGNLPETYGLALQAGMLFLAARVLTHHGARWDGLGLGALAGLAIALRLTLFGIPVVAALLLLVMLVWSRSWRRLADLAWIGLGFGLVCLAWIIFFGVQGALPDLWDQVFRYPMRYAGITNPERLAALRKALSGFLTQPWFILLGLLTWLVVLPFLFSNDARIRAALTSRRMGWFFLGLGILILFNGLWDDRTGGLYALSALSRYRLLMLAVGLAACAVSALFFARWVRRGADRLFPGSSPGESTPLLLPLGIALIDLPLELALSSLAGQAQAHRYAPMLPSLAILVAFLVWSAAQALPVEGSRSGVKLWLAVLALPLLVPGWWATLVAVQPRETEHIGLVADYVREHTAPDDAILQWGGEPRIYFLSQREAASRYNTQQALFTPGYTTAEKIEELLADLQSRPPALIVDTRPERTPLLTAASADCARFAADDFLYGQLWSEHTGRFPLAVDDPLPFVHAEMKLVYRWVCENYILAWPENPAPDDWRIYRLSRDMGGQP